MICSSVNLLFFMSVILHGLTDFSTLDWYGWRGAGQLLKRERIRRKTYLDRDEARRDIFDYIEMFYNPKRRHGYTNDVSPIEYEKRYFNRLTSV